MSHHPRFLLWFGALLVSCSEYEVSELEPGLAMLPEALDLGEIPVGDSVEAELTLINTGLAPLELEGFELSGDSLELTLPEGPLEAGDSAVASLLLSVEGEGELSGAITVLAASELSATTNWTALGTLADIEVDPAELLFSNLLPGESQLQALAIANRGQAPLLVESVAVEGDSCGAYSATLLTHTLPFELEPDTSETVLVDFAPSTTDPCEAEVSIGSDDPDEPTVLVPLQGNLEPANSRPAVHILTPADGDVLSLAQEYTLRAFVLDAETPAEELEVVVSSAQAGELAQVSPDSTGELLVPMIAELGGEDTLTVVATDPEGSSSSDSIGVTVTDCEEASWYRDEHFDAAFDYTLFSMNGSAYRDESNAELVLTEAVDTTAGAVYIEQPFLLERFRASIDFRVEPGNCGADGLALAWVGGAAADELLGQAGEALGVGELAGSYGYVVEVDVYQNSDRGDPEEDHLALVSLPTYAHVTTPIEVGELEDGVTRNLSVDFDMGELTVHLDGALLVETSITHYAPFEGYLGVTAATGLCNNRHVIERWEVETGCW